MNDDDLRERINRLEHALLEVVALLDNVQWTFITNPVKWGQGTAIGQLLDQQVIDEAAVAEEQERDP